MLAFFGGTEFDGLGDLVPIFLILVIVVAVPLIIRHSRKRSNKGFVPVRKQWQGRQETSQMRRSADHILVELVETSREISGRMDTKIRILNTLIRDAERCIERLEELQDVPQSKRMKTKVSPERSREMKAALSAVGRPETAEAESRMNALPQDASLSIKGSAVRTENLGQPDILQELSGLKVASSRPSSVVATKPSAVAQVSNEDSNRKLVIQLLQQGFTVPEVARQIGISRQEVSMIKHLDG